MLLCLLNMLYNYINTYIMTYIKPLSCFFNVFSMLPDLYVAQKHWIIPSLACPACSSEHHHEPSSLPGRVCIQPFCGWYLVIIQISA